MRNDEWGEESVTCPLTLSTDTCKMLVYKNLRKAIRDRVDDENKTVNETFTVNGTSPHIINYSGHYSLILSIKLPQALELKRWVTAVFLTPIRKTGGYIWYTIPRILAREFILFISTTKDKFIKIKKKCTFQIFGL